METGAVGPRDGTPGSAPVLVGGVGQLYQGDLDLGRRAADRLEAEDLGPGVVVEELHYGAVAVAQRLEDLEPRALVLVGAVERGREPGSVARRRVRAEVDPAEAQGAVRESITGYVDLDLVCEVAAGMECLPSRTVAIEVEPVSTEPSEELTPEGEEALEEAVARVRTEVRRVPVLELGDRVRARLEEHPLEPTRGTRILEDLLAALATVDEEGRWGATFALAERLRMCIAAGEEGEGMEAEDWVLWWGLIEELERQRRADATDETP